MYNGKNKVNLIPFSTCQQKHRCDISIWALEFLKTIMFLSLVTNWLLPKGGGRGVVGQGGWL
jgi:hypothetical protein